MPQTNIILRKGEWYWVQYAGHIVPMKYQLYGDKAYFHYIKTDHTNDPNSEFSRVFACLTPNEVVVVAPLGDPPAPPFREGYYWVKHVRIKYWQVRRFHTKELLDQFSKNGWTVGDRLEDVPVKYQ